MWRSHASLGVAVIIGRSPASFAAGKHHSKNALLSEDKSAFFVGGERFELILTPAVFSASCADERNDMKRSSNLRRGSHSPSHAKNHTPIGMWFFGGEREIRTLGRVLAYTRFPVVRLRPAQPSLHADPCIISYSFFKIKPFLKKS